MCDASAEKERLIEVKAFDSGFVNGLMMLGNWIRTNEKKTAQTDRILDTITELAGVPNEN